MDPVSALHRIAYLLERQRAPHYRSRAFRRAAERFRELGEAEVRRRIAEGTLLDARDIGEATAEVIVEALEGRVPTYLAKLESASAAAKDSPSAKLRRALWGDFHAHTDWSADIVVASVHSKLRMPADLMTERMLRAIRNPHMDVLGHMTGRIVVGRGRPESTFDAEQVLRACADHDKAIEINSRPERLDPPHRLMRLARCSPPRDRTRRHVTFAVKGSTSHLRTLRTGKDHGPPGGARQRRR